MGSVVRRAVPPGPRARRRYPAVVAAAVLLVTACGGEGDTEPDPTPTSAPTVAAVTEEGLRQRLEDLAEATGEEPPFRAVGSAGFDRAAALVAEHLERAGWVVEPDAYETAGYLDAGGSVLEVGGERLGDGDLLPLVFAPSGEVSGPVVALGGAPGAAERSGLGCRAEDYASVPEGALVLVPPGGCLRRDQLLAAQSAGAGAYLTHTPGLPDDLVLRPTLVRPDGLTIPAAWVSAAASDALGAAADRGDPARLVVTGRTVQTPTRSVVAELPGAREDVVVMLGAHLDSVLDGPGLNDDGSGVAALLELADVLAGTEHEATLRVAFWSGEELGLQGSTHYVQGLSEAERDAVAVYVNADMVGSPNGFAGVYREEGAAPGSAAAADRLWAAVERSGGSPVAVDLHQSSDHYAFTTAGIPTAGVFSGAVEPVTEAQAAASGAEAGRPADACYHQPCDDLGNVDLALARVLTTALVDFTARVAADPGLLTG